MKWVEKHLNHFLLLYLNTKLKSKTSKANENNTNLCNFEIEQIQEKLCQIHMKNQYTEYQLIEPNA